MLLSSITDQEEVTVIVIAVVRAADHWNLTNAEAACLFDVPIATWMLMRDGEFVGSLGQDKVTRASLLIGIFKSLRTLFHGPLTYGWIKQPNNGPLFEGLSPLDHMMTGMPALISVRKHLEALCHPGKYMGK